MSEPPPPPPPKYCINYTDALVKMDNVSELERHKIIQNLVSLVSPSVPLQVYDGVFTRQMDAPCLCVLFCFFLQLVLLIELVNGTVVKWSEFEEIVDSRRNQMLLA